MAGQQPPFTESNSSALQYLYSRDIVGLMSAISTDTRSNRHSVSYATLHNARRTLVFATDRLYQALLYARLLKGTGPMQIAVDLADMPTSDQGILRCPDTSLWPDSAPTHVDTFNREPEFVQMTTKESQQSNRDMASFSLLLALSLLPEDLSDDLSFTILSSSPDANASPARLLSTVASAMQSSGAESVPLGELVACLVHRCLP